MFRHGPRVSEASVINSIKVDFEAVSSDLELPFEEFVGASRGQLMVVAPRVVEGREEKLANSSALGNEFFQYEGQDWG
jgi:hypothetical protein